jgi:hypothetical protein
MCIDERNFFFVIDVNSKKSETLVEGFPEDVKPFVVTCNPLTDNFDATKIKGISKIRSVRSDKEGHVYLCKRQCSCKNCMRGEWNLCLYRDWAGKWGDDVCPKITLGKAKKEESPQQQFKNWFITNNSMYRDFQILHVAHPTVNASGDLLVNTSGKEGEVTYIKLLSPPFQAKQKDCTSDDGRRDGLNFRIALGEYCVRARVLNQKIQEDGAILLVPDKRKQYSAQIVFPLLNLVIPQDLKAISPKDFVVVEEAEATRGETTVQTFKIDKAMRDQMNSLSKNQLEKGLNRPPPTPKKKQGQKRKKSGPGDNGSAKKKQRGTCSVLLNPWGFSKVWDGEVTGPRKSKMVAFQTTCKPQTETAAAASHSGYTFNDDEDDDVEGYVHINDESSDSEDEEDEENAMRASEDDDEIMDEDREDGEDSEHEMDE